MSPEKFARSINVVSLDPPTAHWPEYVTLCANIQERKNFYLFLSRDEGKRIMGVVLYEVEYGEKDAIRLLPSYFAGKKVRVKSVYVYTQSTVRLEDIKMTQDILQIRPLDTEALERAPLTDIQKIFMRFYWFNVAQTKNVRMKLVIKAKPREVIVRRIGKGNLVSIFIPTDIISIRSSFEPIRERFP